jgi:hypothetical protein
MLIYRGGGAAWHGHQGDKQLMLAHMCTGSSLSRSATTRMKSRRGHSSATPGSSSKRSTRPSSRPRCSLLGLIQINAQRAPNRAARRLALPARLDVEKPLRAAAERRAEDHRRQQGSQRAFRALLCLWLVWTRADASEQAIRDWLHSIPTDLNPAEIRRGYLTYTKNKLKQAKRTAAPTPRGLVDELDPDAVRRAGTAGLDADDAVRPSPPPLTCSP